MKKKICSPEHRGTESDGSAGSGVRLSPVEQMQRYALDHPRAYADGNAAPHWRRINDWSIILTVNK